MCRNTTARRDILTNPSCLCFFIVTSKYTRTHINYNSSTLPNPWVDRNDKRCISQRSSDSVFSLSVDLKQQLQWEIKDHRGRGKMTEVGWVGWNLTPFAQQGCDEKISPQRNNDKLACLHCTVLIPSTTPAQQHGWSEGMERVCECESSVFSVREC